MLFGYYFKIKQREIMKIKIKIKLIFFILKAWELL
jgi:hypothetical protein